MTKIFNSLLLTLAATALLAACVKEAPAPERQREMVTVTASVPEATKVAFEDAADNGLSLSWEDGDCLRIISGSESGRYDILDDFEEHKARFRGPEVTGEKYNILYPGTFESVEEAAEFDFAGQVQNGNDNKDHLRYITLLEGVDTKEDICFSDEWAAAHGGTYKQNGVVKFVLTLPNRLTSPQKVQLTGLEKEVSLKVKNVTLTSSHVLTAYALTPWENIAVPAGSNLSVIVTDAQGGTWRRDFSVAKETALQAGVQSVFRITKGFEETLFAGGSGTENDPYLIASAKHMFNMHADGVLEQGKKTWFKMIEDVDMSMVTDDWEPLNYVNPYSCEVDFDGGGYTIDNFTCTRTEASGAGFFRVLYGTVHDVKFTNAVITNSVTNPCGILGSFGGYNGLPAVVYNVHVHGSVTHSADYNGVGGMFGRIGNIDIESSSADCQVTSNKNYVGGLYGYDFAASTIRNCWTSGKVSAGQRAGGIGGSFGSVETAIYNCYSTATVEAGFCLGGIVGHCNLDKASSVSPSTTDPQNVLEKCIAWNDLIKAKSFKSGDKSHYSTGAIAGYIATHNYLTDCYRKADIDIQDYSDLFPIYDQENATPSKPLVIQEVADAPYNFPYHGKAAASGRTLSQVAQSLGWNSQVWDFSGPLPQLTGLALFVDNEQQSGAPNAPTGTNSKPGQEVRPAAGNGWTVQQVVAGENDIMYYAFDGKESYTGKTQQIFVIDFDLSSTKYKLQFVYEKPVMTNSEVFYKYGAIASINCGYEISSIAYKNDGMVRSMMPNNTISDTGVANWKNEGAFYFDGDRTVKFSFDGYGLSISEQRKFYTYHTSEWPNLVTSAPMLINDFALPGRTFVDPYPSSASPSTEQPGYHQRATHPRTAIALTEGGHLLFVVVDGRYDSSGFSIGMSAKQLTMFLANNFNPQYALNLDGGGSSTMCVRPYGVVNYPCDNVKSKGLPHDHEGERARDTHLVIVPR
jgi:hypothetical protein